MTKKQISEKESFVTEKFARLAFSAKGILEASFYAALLLRSQNPEKKSGFFLYPPAAD